MYERFHFCNVKPRVSNEKAYPRSNGSNFYDLFFSNFQKGEPAFKSFGSASSSSDNDSNLDQNISALTNDIKSINDKINEIEQKKVEKLPNQSFVDVTLAMDNMESTIENLIAKMEGLEEKLETTGSGQSKVTCIQKSRLVFQLPRLSVHSSVFLSVCPKTSTNSYSFIMNCH